MAAQPTGDMFASGSVDQSIRLWGTEPDAAEPGKKTSKRRKVRGEGEGEGEADEVPIKRALGRLTGSAGAVHTLCWPERGTLYRSVPLHTALPVVFRCCADGESTVCSRADAFGSWVSVLTLRPLHAVPCDLVCAAVGGITRSGCGMSRWQKRPGC